METKKVTLRSQTVQCPHCGEYYSVTYKYCPFCDAGRQEEERRLAEKKKKKQDFFGNLFGSHAGNKKGSKPEKSPKAPSEEEGVQDYDLLEAVQPKPKQVRPSRDHAEKKPTVKETAKKKAPTRRRGARKKTSEMTEEEKAAARADREARAAARKRERDRKAREAALAAAETAAAQPAQEAQPDQVEMTATPGETGPVFDQPTVPETFGYDQPPLVEPDPAAFTPTPVSAEGPVVEPDPAPVQETPAFTPAAQGPAESEWDALKDLNTLAGQPEAAPEIPEAIPAPTAEIQVGQTTVEPAAPAQADQQPQPAPQAEPPVNTEEDLDALLREVRDLLAESPVPTLTQEQLEKPAQPVEEVAIQEEPEAEAAPEAPAQAVPQQQAPAAEPPVEQAQPPQEEAPRADFDVEEPTIHIGEIPTQALWQGDGQDKPAAENYADVIDDQPTQVIPTQEISKEIQAQQAAKAQEDEAAEPQPAQEDLLEAVLPPQAKAPTAEEKAAARRAARKKKKKQGMNPVLLIVSLIIVVAAVFIVVRTVVPAFQTGIFSSQQAAEGLTLDRETLDLAEAGTTMTLVPPFSPEGSTGTVTWSSSDEAVATVDGQGMVTAVAPGTATITATLENGQSAQCTVSCTWDPEAAAAEAAQAAADGEEAPAEQTTVGLSANDITLDSAGDSQQLTVNGAEGDVTWASEDTAVATVDDQGNVTAVAPGRTTVTATVGDQTFNCAVRCIW